jgi:hypothetical protein
MIQVFNNIAAQSSQAESIKTFAETGQAAATIVALIVGGAWTYILFIRKRQRFPRATLDHVVTVTELSPEFLLVHLDVRIQNVGEVLLELRYSDIQLRRIIPLDAEVAETLREGKDPVQDGNSEVDWPGIGRRECNWEKNPREIEPGEYDRVHYDFVIGSSVAVLSAYSYFRNVAKKNREIGWNCTTLHNTSTLLGTF